MIADGRATVQEPAKPDSQASQEIFCRYGATGPARWLPMVFAVAWALLGTVQFMRRGQWFGLAFAAAFAAVAVFAVVVPRIVISDRGVRFFGRRIIPWSQVADVVGRPSNGWKGNPPELVLCDGRRKQLELNASQIDGLRAFARRQGAPIPP